MNTPDINRRAGLSARNWVGKLDARQGAALVILLDLSGWEDFRSRSEPLTHKERVAIMKIYEHTAEEGEIVQ